MSIKSARESSPEYIRVREEIAKEFYIALNMNRTGFTREFFTYEYPRLPKEPQYDKQDPINSLPYYNKFADFILAIKGIAILADNQTILHGLTARLNLPDLEHYLYADTALNNANFKKVV